MRKRKKIGKLYLDDYIYNHSEKRNLRELILLVNKVNQLVDLVNEGITEDTTSLWTRIKPILKKIGLILIWCFIALGVFCAWMNHYSSQ